MSVAIALDEAVGVAVGVEVCVAVGVAFGVAVVMAVGIASFVDVGVVVGVASQPVPAWKQPARATRTVSSAIATNRRIVPDPSGNNPLSRI